MSENININKLLEQIENLKKENQELKSSKKFGLVWEEKFDEKETMYPTLESKNNGELDFISDSTKPMNYLIEGDNYDSLKVLNYTHKGLIDVIYIDPPYNTGNKDFKYNDKFVDSEDGFRHSKWLSFMNKRLKLAKELLSEDGVIFISIDDNEQHRLRMLCDDVFGEKNIEIMIWEKVGDGNASAGKMKTTYRFRIEHEYILVPYSTFVDIKKGSERVIFNKLKISIKVKKFKKFLLRTIKKVDKYN